MYGIAVGFLLLAALPAMAPPAAAQEFAAILDGARVAPPNRSPGRGEAVVTVAAAGTLRVRIDFAGLAGETTAAHIHCCTAQAGRGIIGIAVTPVTLSGFPVGIRSGTYEQPFDLDRSSTYTLHFIANFGGGTLVGAAAALIAGMRDGRAYVDIHSTAYPDGELRGFLRPVTE
jgi:hypothetical protein